MGCSTDPGPPIYGNDCHWCYDPGLTPKYLYANFSDVSVCDDHPDPAPPFVPETFEMEQRPGHACEWLATVGAWVCHYEADHAPGNTFFALTYNGNAIFRGLDADRCAIWFANTIDCDIGFGFGGNCAISSLPLSLSPLSTRGLMALINMPPDPETKYEYWPTDDGHQVTRFCRKLDGTNIHIKTLIT